MKTALRPNGILCCQGKKNTINCSHLLLPQWRQSNTRLSCLILSLIQKDQSQKMERILTWLFSFLYSTGECQWLHLQLIKDMQTFCKSLFPVVDYAYCTIPTYPSGQIGFMCCSKNPVSFSFSHLLLQCLCKNHRLHWKHLSFIKLIQSLSFFLIYSGNKFPCPTERAVQRPYWKYES